MKLTNNQANYWWGQMHCGPPNKNFGWHTRSTLQPSAWGLGIAVSSPSGIRGGTPRPQSHNSKTHLVVAFFGSLVCIAMSGKMKANPGSGNLRHKHKFKLAS